MNIIGTWLSLYQSSDMFFSGLELKHWKEMVENPRRPIVHWHVLKVNEHTDKMITHDLYLSILTFEIKSKEMYDQMAKKMLCNNVMFR